ncbi:MAG TPA: hypothetical protein VGK27_03940 [Candidatus Deferrimicrobiaceae bacterium]|jgi:hypothetical protein
MNRLHIAALIPAAAILFFASGAFAAGLTVDLKNDDARSVSISIGADNGVTPESDFEVVIDAEHTIPVFPVEIFPLRFWSAPLAPDDYDAIRTGMAIQPLKADKTTHRLMRKMAAEQQKTLRREQAEVKRAETGKKLDDLLARRARLVAQKDKIDGWIVDADRGLADETDRAQWRDDSADQDIARSQQRIDDLTDQRNELQAQRDALPRKDRAGYDRLTSQITSVNAGIASERNSLRYAQDRKRDSRTFVDRGVRDKRKLQADRDALAVEIRALDREIANMREK